MAAQAATPLHPTHITYKDHDITLTHRPKTNDWYYSVEHTQTITLTGHCGRYDAALRAAKKDVDTLEGE